MNELSDFAKQVIKIGKIKDISEAFEKYPVEEEYHKGKSEYYVAEPSSEYHLYGIGDIVFVNEYFYKDGTKGRNHMFVIIDNANIAVPIEYFGMIISSNIKKAYYKSNKLIKKNNVNNLDKDSIVKTDEIYKISNKQILCKIGMVEIEKVKEYKELYLKNNV